MTASAHIIAARRSIVAPRGGALSQLELHDLGAPVLRQCVTDAGLDLADVDEVLVSNALGAGGNVARLIALASGCPETVAGLTIDRQCAGGLDAIGMASALVTSGMARVVIAGGVESYSRRPLRFRTDPAGGEPVAYDRPAFSPWPERDPDLADAADALGISREEQDSWTMRSHEKAVLRREALRSEIVDLTGETADPFARSLAPRVIARAPVISGSITAGNTAVAADAAAFCVVVAPDLVQGRAALEITDYASIGGDPASPAIAPIAAIHRVSRDPVDQIELMEAYAAQAIACTNGASLDPETINLRGGALARGHPIGASGAILLVRLFHDLAGSGRSGLAAIAAAGGIGSAMRVRG